MNGIMKMVTRGAQTALGFCKKHATKALVAVGIMSVAAPFAHATDPTTLDGFSVPALAYIGLGTTIGIASAVLSLGWVAFRIIRKFTARAAS